MTVVAGSATLTLMPDVTRILEAIESGDPQDGGIEP